MNRSRKIFITQLLVLIVSVLALATVFLIQKDPPEKIVITLYVDTDKIESVGALSSSRFEAEYSKSRKIVKSGGDVTQFKIKAKVNDTIIWRGVAENGKSLIDIDKIYRERGREIFDKRTLIGIPSGNTKNRIVEGQIQKRTWFFWNFKYTIYFKVDDKDKVYSIDPKIKVGNSFSLKDERKED